MFERQFDSLIELVTAIPDEQTAIDHFTAIRWKNGAYCPYCGSTKVYHFSDKRTHKCGDCRQRFSIKVGTIFEDTKIPLRKWFMAVWMLTSHKKGIASTQLAKDIKVTQKTAWFMLHRLRHAAMTKSFNRKLSGIVECDETFVGGKERNKHASQRKHRGRGGVGKAVVFGLKERNGELRAMPVEDLKAATGEYVRHFVLHTNGIEGVWALLKRQIIGIHHWVSEKHLSRYVGEMTWRFNRREFSEGSRMNALLASTNGRLTYQALIG